MPTLERLLAGRHELVGVVSQPDRPRGRGRRLTPSPVAARALEAGRPLLRPADVNAPGVLESLGEWRADLGVVVAFGQFVGRRVREHPSLGYLINGHASLLPRWRGAAPIQRAILAGDERTGVSIMKLVREMDAGPVCLCRSVEIGSDDDAGALAERLAGLSAECVSEAVDRIEQGVVEWREQDPAGVTLAPKLSRDEARLDWSQPADALARTVRAFAPRPGAFTELDGDPLRILAARAEPGEPGRTLQPGTVQALGPAGFRVSTGDGWLVPTRLQRAGGRPLDVAAFLRGRPLDEGTRLGDAPSATLAT